jgi:O-antigen/teichoic acid export membrane protein
MLAKLKQVAVSSPLRRNIGMTLGRQILAAAAQLLLVVLIARELGPEGNGYYAMAVLVPSLLTNFLNLGVGPATVFHVSRGDFDVRQAKAGNLWLAFIVAFAGVAISLPILYLWADALFPDIPVELLYLGLASFPASLLIAYLNTILQGLENFKAYNLTVLLPPYINLAAVIIMLYGLQIGVVGAVVGYLIGQFMGCLAALMLVQRSKSGHGATGEAVPFSRYAGKTLGYGWKAHLSNILAFVNYRADIFLVNLFLTPALTGVYVIAVQIAERLWMLSQAASAVLLPRLSTMHADPRGRLALTKKGFLVVSGLTALAGMGLAIALYWLLGPIFGDEYLQAFPAFAWLLPGIIAGAGARVQSSCIAAAGKPEWNMYVAIGVVTLNIVGNILLVPRFGIVGAAWATSVAYLCNALIKFYLVRKTANIM